MKKESIRYKFESDLDGNYYLLPERLWSLWKELTWRSSIWYEDEGAKEILDCQIDLTSDYFFENPKLLNGGVVSESISEPELMPCPFCGSDDVHVQNCDDSNYVECNQCKATGPRKPCWPADDDAARDARAVIEPWNTVYRIRANK